MNRPSIIAISGKSGCGNSTVSKLLSEKLGRRLVNYTFHTMAEEMGIPFERLLSMAKLDASYDKQLDRRQVAMAHEEDCVIGSRLAIWMVPEAQLRVYLYADPETRARRIMKREGGDMESILAFTNSRDKQDNERYRALYNIDNDDYRLSDLVINVNRISPEQIVHIIMSAAEFDFREGTS